MNSMCSDFACPGYWVPKDKFHKQLPKVLLYVTLIRVQGYPVLPKLDPRTPED